MNNRARLLVTLGSFVVYGLIFVPMYSVAGATVGTLTVMPVAVAGWCLGLRAGLLSGLLGALLSLGLYILVRDPLASVPVPHALNGIAWAAVGTAMGGLKGLLDQITEQSSSLMREREDLQEEVARRKEAETVVAERTAELIETNAQLQQEVVERKRAEEQLRYGAFHDPLTGLPNRTLFMDRLGHALERTRRREDYSRGAAVLFLDLDRFKVVNDSLGHSMVDQLLIECARRLEACLRAADTVARLGGDEFVILLEDIQGMDDATYVAVRIQDGLAPPFSLDGRQTYISASIGIVLSTMGYDRPEDILRDADIAMYRAKVLGRARYEVFDTTMRDLAVARLGLETDLRRAVEQQEFRLYYQPIVLLETGAVVGFEALVRWQHPERGLVLPPEFIPVAEETGLIIPIGQWVLREACHQLREWQSQFPMDPPLTISVNFSAKQFAQADLIEQVSRVLQETGIEPGSLRLEITESVIVEEAATATTTLAQLRTLGVEVQIDDFGMGYSALSYLHRLPIDTLKVDRTFVAKMGADGDGSEIVRTVLALARDMGMSVIAEGVEAEYQLAKLKELRCEYAQGHLFAKPTDGKTAGALITEALASR